MTNDVVTTLHPSPRVFPIPLYDPNYYETGKLNGRNADLKVANWIGFFLEEIGPLVYNQFVQQNNWPFGGAVAFILMGAILGAWR